MGRDNASFNRKTRERASAGGHLVNASLPILSNNSRICMQIRRAGRKRKEEAAQRGSHLILLGDTELLLRRHNCWNMKNCFSIQPTRLETASYEARRRDGSSYSQTKTADGREQKFGDLSSLSRANISASRLAAAVPLSSSPISSQK